MRWRDLGFRWKITLSLWLAAALPVTIVTYSNVRFSRTTYIQTLTNSLQEKGKLLTTDFVLWSLDEAKREAEEIARTAEATKIKFSGSVNDRERALLRSFLQLSSDASPESIKNFKIIVNDQGRIIAANGQIINETFIDNPPLSAEGQIYRPTYRSVNIGSSSLDDLDILKKTLNEGVPQSGSELLKSSLLQRLGIAPQAQINPRPQKTAGLKQDDAPFPDGKFDIEGGKIGLVNIATYPIKVEGKTTGAVLIGSLINRNYGIVEVFQAKANIPVATIFAQDFRVNTSVPYANPETGKPDNTRAIGTRVSREVAETVLLAGKTFTGETNIVGKPYLTYYEPLFNHQQNIVGMSFVGISRQEVDRALQANLIQSYTIGFITLLILLFAGAYIANTIVAPIKQLAAFAKGVGTDNLQRIDIDRGDEIGQLGASFNQMLESLEVALKAQMQEVERSIALKEESERLAQEQQQAKEFLQKRALELLLEVDPISRGDLTTRAKVTPDEIGTIADSYNSLVRSLRELVMGVQQSATTVTNSTMANEEAVKTVAIGAKKQVESLQEALQQVEVMTSSLQQVGRQAQKAQSQVNSAVAVVADGDRAITETVAGITSAREKVTQAAEKMELLEVASEKIARVVKLIGNFAAQTNLLALNASIEAARAGEEGASFKVVADEVRALAQRSTEATREIRRLLEDIEIQVGEVVSAIKEGTEQVSESTELIEVARQRLSEVNRVSNEISQLIEDIAQSSVAQLTTSDRVKTTMEAVAAIAVDNSQQSETVAQTFNELLALAQNLQDQVGRFKI
ncbi:MAG: methyl-accepting chemotaxis protein [Cyanobacteria bacterium KgW148]|nr:methyl-accepting chemotaxis protein [Cyanobacteria bacterium KgW148]